MTKEKICQRVSKRNIGLNRKMVRLAIRTVFDTISEGFVEGRRTEIRGLGTFDVKTYEPRLAHNPRTREKIQLERRVLPVFHAGKPLQRRLNPHT